MHRRSPNGTRCSHSHTTRSIRPHRSIRLRFTRLRLLQFRNMPPSHCLGIELKSYPIQRSQVPTCSRVIQSLKAISQPTRCRCRKSANPRRLQSLNSNIRAMLSSSIKVSRFSIRVVASNTKARPIAMLRVLQLWFTRLRLQAAWLVRPIPEADANNDLSFKSIA